ncbi:MAG TPA: hypothetical protein VKU82_01060 [Planctomycetaceae bacterium]|nr:hypothetical protein [Planctomycetaceae bacterium]
MSETMLNAKLRRLKPELQQTPASLPPFTGGSRGGVGASVCRQSRIGAGNAHAERALDGAIAPTASRLGQIVLEFSFRLRSLTRWCALALMVS